MSAVLATALSREGRVERVTHGFHTYPAGLHPDAARDLIGLLPEGPILDPFCGGGTTLVEAMLAGRDGLGRDLSPVARLVATARTTWTDETTRQAMRSAARKLTAAAREQGLQPPPAILDTVRDWYDPHVIGEIEVLRRGTEAADEAIRPLLRAVLSSILIKASHRRSDTSARRVAQERPPGTTAVLFHKKARELGRRLEALEQAVGEARARIEAGDAREVPPGGPFAGVVTSPPYPGTYDYLSMQALREAWLGLDAPRSQEIGPRRDWRGEDRAARARWLDDTQAWTSATAQALRPEGRMIVVIGDGHDRRGRIDTLAVSRDAMVAAGLRVEAWASADREDLGRDLILAEHAIVAVRPRP